MPVYKKRKRASTKGRKPAPKRRKAAAKPRRAARTFAAGKRTSKGGYFRRALKFGSRYAPALGGLLGAFAPDPGMGARVGKLIGYGLSALGKISGQGAYRLSGGGRIGAGNQVPSFGNLRATTEGGVVVCHREYVADVESGASGAPSTSFDVQPYAINPGNSQLFPWLATIANNFEQYKIRGLVFHFRTMSGNSVASSNTALGAVIMATEYNSANPVFTSKAQMENYAHGQSGVPSEDIIHELECQKSQTTISAPYVRGAFLPGGQDPRLYDFGTFQIATQGMQANSTVLGELWVTYCIELIKPRLQSVDPPLPPPSGGFLIDHYKFSSGTVSATGSRYFGNPATDLLPEYGGFESYVYANLSGAYDYIAFPGYGNGNAADRLPVGTILRIDYWALGASTTLTNALAITLGSSWTSGPNMFMGSNNSITIGAGSVNNSQSATWFIKKTANTAQIGDWFAITAGTLPTSLSAVEAFITVMPFGLT